jgi:hypothetical protein
MNEWTLADARQCLGEVIRRAERCGPQRVAGPDGNAVVLSADEFQLLLADAGMREDELRGANDALEREPMGLVELMQTSPLAEAMRSGEWPWEWDDATRTWVLPGDAIPA